MLDSPGTYDRLAKQPSSAMLVRRNLQFRQLEGRFMLAAANIFEPHQIDLTSSGGFIQARSAYAADLDGDGDLDVVSASRKEAMIAWHENMGDGIFGQQRIIISDQATGVDFVFAKDMDGDGDPDVLYSSSGQDRIAWHENTGAGSFSKSKLIFSGADSPSSLAVADLDGDGDLDVISASANDDTVAWYENSNSAETFGPQQIITDNADVARSVFPADLDGDGDFDILSASARDDTIAWHENEDGAGQFGHRKVISIPNPGGFRSYFVSAADLDGDGDLDVLSASDLDRDVSWYENLDGRGTFGPEHVIMHDLFRRPFARVDSVYAADLDSDGDLDVVAAEEFGHRTLWVENTDGRGKFATQQPIGPTSELTGGSFQIVDIDDDGDSDILAASDHEGIIAWHENRLVGDSNDDGVFTTSDLISVFQVGEYQDDIPSNSTFDEGDWNLDGDFNTSDLVFAFQADTFSVPSAKSTLLNAAVADWLFRDGLERTRGYFPHREAPMRTFK